MAICGGWNNDTTGNNGFLDNPRSNINDLSCLTNISKSFKSSVEKLFIHNNNLQEDLSFLDGFSGVKLLNISVNNITTLKGIKNCSSLKELYIYKLENLGINDNLDYSNENNSLFELQFCKALVKIDCLQATNNKCKLLSYIMSCEKISYIRFSTDSFDMDDIVGMKDFLNNLTTCNLNAKYSLALLSDDATVLNLNGREVDVDEFKALKNHPGIKEAWLHGIKLMKDNVELGDTEFTTVFTEIVGSWSNLEKLDCCNTRILNLDFIRNENKTNTPNLIVLNILGTSITDLSNIKYVELEGLGINNSSINLVDIEQYIKKMRSCWMRTWFLWALFREKRTF